MPIEGSACSCMATCTTCHLWSYICTTCTPALALCTSNVTELWALMPWANTVFLHVWPAPSKNICTPIIDFQLEPRNQYKQPHAIKIKCLQDIPTQLSAQCEASEVCHWLPPLLLLSPQRGVTAWQSKFCLLKPLLKAKFALPWSHTARKNFHRVLTFT